MLKMIDDANAAKIGSAVVPVMRYRNLPAAIDWLCSALGFEKHRVTVDSDGAILFAQLTFGGSLIMASPVGASAFDKLMKQPDEVGGAETQVCYFFVADAHAHCARAKAAGAEIIFDVEDRANGGRSYSCRDPEGHVWNFGTYNPWHDRAMAHTSQRSKPERFGILGKGSLVVAVMLAGAAATVVSSGRGPAPAPADHAAPAPIETGSIRAEQDPESMPERLARDRAADAQREEAVMAAEHRLALALLEMDALRKAAREAEEQRLQATTEKEATEQLNRELQERLFMAWVQKTAAERAAKEARRQSVRVRVIRTPPPAQ
jgi:uncharacterized glyoxalase superfamily protein PhnB